MGNPHRFHGKVGFPVKCGRLSPASLHVHYLSLATNTCAILTAMVVLQLPRALSPSNAISKHIHSVLISPSFLVKSPAMESHNRNAMTEPLPAAVPLPFEAMSNTDGDGDVDESGRQDEGHLLDDYGDENVDIFASSLLQPSSPSKGVIASSYMDHVRKYNEDGLENEMIDRPVVYISRCGVGKTSLFGCYQGNENLQRLQLASHTRTIKAAYRAMTYFYETDKRTVDIVWFKCYDTQGFTGNPTVEETILSLFHFFLQTAP